MNDRFLFTTIHFHYCKTHFVKIRYPCRGGFRVQKKLVTNFCEVDTISIKVVALIFVVAIVVIIIIVNVAIFLF